jgi:uncharacterized lipoprotein YddW (UPF0748 family)
MNPLLRAIISFCILSISLTCTYRSTTGKEVTITAQKPRHEFRRGLWVRAASIASPDSVSRVLEVARKMNITDIFAQVVVGGYAYYNSSMLPRSQYLSRISEPDYDPLDSLINECANTPIRVHAWVNTLLCWSLDEPPDSANHVFHLHPDWFIRDVNSRSMADYTYTQWKNSRLEGLYLDPQKPEVAIFVRDICTEIASQYAVDGVHLDFIRYPAVLWGLPHNDEAALLAGVDGETALWCSIIRYGRSELYERWTIWNAWRITRGRQYTIARMVSNIHTALDTYALKDECCLSAAVFANPSVYRYSFAQNWTQWTNETFHPVVMSYTPDTILFGEYAKHALSHRPDAMLGIGVLWPEMRNISGLQEQQIRNMAGSGVCYFDFTAIDTMIEAFIVDRSKISEEGEPISIDSSRYLPVEHAFESRPRVDLARAGISPSTWGNALEFTAFLLSLSMNAEVDLRRMGLTRDGFLHHVYADIVTFEYLHRQIFPIGDTLKEPPAISVRYHFIPWSEGDSLSIVRKAKEISDFNKDTILYPQALDPLTRASFKARTGTIEMLYAPAGIYVFSIDTVYAGGRTVDRKDVISNLLPVYVNWTIKMEAERILENID